MLLQWYDANVSLPGCDKNMPGSIIAMARLNRPSIMVYGGTIKPGHSVMDGSVLDIVSAFQSYGERQAQLGMVLGVSSSVPGGVVAPAAVHVLRCCGSCGSRSGLCAVVALPQPAQPCVMLSYGMTATCIRTSRRIVGQGLLASLCADIRVWRPVSCACPIVLQVLMLLAR